MKMSTMWRGGAAVLVTALVAALGGCVDQSRASSTGGAGDADGLRIVATSPATVDIMARLDIDLVGVPNLSLIHI